MQWRATCGPRAIGCQPLLYDKRLILESNSATQLAGVIVEQFFKTLIHICHSRVHVLSLFVVLEAEIHYDVINVQMY